MMEVGDGTAFERWQDTANYLRLLSLARADWAWELLRRQPECTRFLIMPTSRQLLRVAPPLNLVTLEGELDQDLSWGLRFRRQAVLAGLRLFRLLARRLPHQHPAGGGIYRWFRRRRRSIRPPERPPSGHRSAFARW